MTKISNKQKNTFISERVFMIKPKNLTYFLTTLEVDETPPMIVFTT